MEIVCWIDGKILSSKEARIPVFDRGFLYGHAIFETMRVYEGVVFLMDKHLERLADAISFFELADAFWIENFCKKVQRVISDLINKQNTSNLYIRLTVTGGVGGVGIIPPDTPKPTVVLICKPFVPPSDSVYCSGYKICFAQTRRNSMSFLPRFKTNNILENIFERTKARNKGYGEVVFLNQKGNVAEGSVTNIFCVYRDKVVTPPVSDGLLPGITRAFVLELAAHLGIFVEESSVSQGELFQADEVFLTNSLLEIMPVAQIDDTLIKCPGRITSILLEEYRKKTGKR